MYQWFLERTYILDRMIRSGPYVFELEQRKKEYNVYYQTNHNVITAIMLISSQHCFKDVEEKLMFSFDNIHDEATFTTTFTLNDDTSPYYGFSFTETEKELSTSLIDFISSDDFFGCKAEKNAHHCPLTVFQDINNQPFAWYILLVSPEEEDEKITESLHEEQLLKLNLSFIFRYLIDNCSILTICDILHEDVSEVLIYKIAPYTDIYLEFSSGLKTIINERQCQKINHELNSLGITED